MSCRPKKKVRLSVGKVALLVRVSSKEVVRVTRVARRVRRLKYVSFMLGIYI